MAIAVGNPAKISGKLSVRQPMNSPTSDEPSDIQAAQGFNSVQKQPVVRQSGGGVQTTSSPTKGLSGAINTRMYGRKLKVAR